jgi:hypothetical protein
MYNLGSFFKYFRSIDIFGLPNINGNTEFWKYISELYYFRKIYKLKRPISRYSNNSLWQNQMI